MIIPPTMRTLDIGKLRQEREQLTKRIQQFDVLLDAVAAFDGTGPKKARTPKGKAESQPQAERQ